jgi:molybdenum cofactor guanylyltransferase
MMLARQELPPPGEAETTITKRMRTGALILCGGKSSRMGRDKATLPFGSELMLQRVVRLVCEVIAPTNVVVVAARHQALPELPPDISIARDANEFRGPLQGIATGLRTIGDRIDAVYVTACDVPHLRPAWIDRMFSLLGDFDAAVPNDGQRLHPLAAVYRPSVLPTIEKLLAADRLRPVFLFDEVPTRVVPAADIRPVDPQLATLENLNSPEEYQAALIAAGLA